MPWTRSACRGAVTALTELWPAGQTVAGRVRTVKAGPKAAAGPATHIASPLVAITEPGDVIVIDNHGRTDVSCWGGLLAEAAVGNGAAGVIMDGARRDVADCAALGLPPPARAAVPVSARGRIVQEDMDVPVQVAGVRVCPGAVAVTDRNGVVFVAAAQLPAVLGLAERIAAREQAMAEAVRAGHSIIDVMHDSQFSTVEASPGEANPVKAGS